MARHKAIKNTCRAIIRLLESDYNYKPKDSDPTISFALNIPRSASQSPPAQNTIFLTLYRICPNNSHRIPSGRVMADGKRQKTQLPLDLYFLLTVWCDHAETQQSITGWMMRTLEDTPIIPASHLNEEDGDIFQLDETVELSLIELTTEDMVRIWETLTDSKYYLSVPYVARNVRIESYLTVDEAVLVGERKF
jgi:hypothetical protein